MDDLASRKLDTKLSVSGEQQYKNAIAEINRGIKVLDAEMRKVTAEFYANADSMEALEAQTDVLNRKLISEKDRVAELQEALSYAVKTHGEASKEAMDYQASLYKAEAAVAKTTQAIARNNEAMEDSQEDTEDTASIVDELSARFGKYLPDSLSKALDSTKGFSSGTVLAMGAAAAAVTALVSAERQLLDMTREAAENAKAVETQSLITGMGTEDIQQLQYASKIIGVSTDKISDAQKTLITNMQQAKDGGESYIEMFARLGVQITDSSDQLRDSNDVMYDVIDALGEMQNKTERDAAAMAIMGESARELNPLIAQGSAVLRQYAEDAQETSYVLSTEQVAALASVDEKYQELQLRQEAVRKQLAAEFAPTAEEVYDKFGELVTDAGEALAESGIGDSLGSILTSTIDLIEPVTQLATVALPWLGKALKPVAGMISLIADAGDWLAGLLSFDFERMGVAMGAGISEGKFSNYQQFLGYEQNMGGSYYDPETGRWEGNAYHASGTDNFRGGRTIVGENGPETVILPAGSQILSNQESRQAEPGIYIGTVVIDAKNVKDFTAVVETFRNLRRLDRMGGIS